MLPELLRGSPTAGGDAWTIPPRMRGKDGSAQAATRATCRALGRESKRRGTGASSELGARQPRGLFPKTRSASAGEMIHSGKGVETDGFGLFRDVH